MEQLIRTTVSRQRPVREIVTNLVASFFAFVLAGCAAMQSEYKAFEGDEYSRLHADYVPVDSLRLAQVTSLGTRAEMQDARTRDSDLQENLTIYQRLIALGIPDEEIRDGSVGSGEVVCCGGPNSEDTFIFFYVPPNMDVGVGDIVEIRAGELPGKSDAYPNVVTRLRQTRGTAAGCRWLPENPALWLRTLYCSGIEGEGWIQQGGVYKFWYRPPPS
jgi:hypothetical protein